MNEARTGLRAQEPKSTWSAAATWGMVWRYVPPIDKKRGSASNFHGACEWFVSLRAKQGETKEREGMRENGTLNHCEEGKSLEETWQ